MGLRGIKYDCKGVQRASFLGTVGQDNYLEFNPKSDGEPLKTFT